MKTFAKFATAAAVAGALALSMATPSFAASYRHQQWSHSSRAPVAATNGYGAGYADQASGYADPGYGSYAYAPRAVSGSRVNEQQCMMSPGSQNYEPCFNY